MNKTYVKRMHNKQKYKNDKNDIVLFNRKRKQGKLNLIANLRKLNIQQNDLKWDDLTSM